MTVTDKRIWVTGASSGIGKAVAAKLAALGNQVIISGRNGEALAAVQRLYPGHVTCLPFDITDTEDTMRAAEQIRSEFGALDVAVLNAGTCEYVDAGNIDVDLIRRVNETNYMGFVNCVAAALPLLREGEAPFLLGMSSTVAYTGLPTAEAYGASKAAIRHFLQALRIDLAAEEIDVSIICPGFVQTPLTDLNNFPMPMRITSERAAQYIVRGMARRTHEIRFPPLFALVLLAIGALPSRARHWLIRRTMVRNGD